MSLIRTTLNLEEFLRKKNIIYYYDNHELIVFMKYYDKKSSRLVGEMSYDLCNGRIFNIKLNSFEMRHKTLGKQMLQQMIEHIKTDDRSIYVKNIWIPLLNHNDFFHNVFNQSFKWKELVHPSVNCSGYSMNISSNRE